MNRLYLFARIAGTSVAIRTSEIEAVVKLGSLSPVPGVPRHVAGLSALRSRVLTVLDAAVLINADDRRSAERNYAIVCDISGHSYGFLVDEVIDISAVDNDPRPLHGRIDLAWQNYAEGVIVQDDKPYLVVPLASFVEGGGLSQAA